MDDGKESNIFVYDLSGATSMRRLTFAGRNSDPVWAGDDRIAFTSDREGDSGDLPGSPPATPEWLNV